MRIAIEHPIKLLVVNLAFMRFGFRQYDAITKAQFDDHKKQFDMLLNMLMAPKAINMIKRHVVDNKSFESEAALVALTNFVEEIALKDMGISDEDIDEVFFQVAAPSTMKEQMSWLYFHNIAPKVEQAYNSYIEFANLMNSAYNI